MPLESKIIVVKAICIFKLYLLLYIIAHLITTFKAIIHLSANWNNYLRFINMIILQALNLINLHGLFI